MNQFKAPTGDALAIRNRPRNIFLRNLNHRRREGQKIPELRATQFMAEFHRSPRARARTFARRKTLRAKLVVLSTCCATPGSPALTNLDPYWMLRQILSRTSALFRYITRKAISALVTSSVAAMALPLVAPASAPRSRQPRAYAMSKPCRAPDGNAHSTLTGANSSSLRAPMRSCSSAPIGARTGTRSLSKFPATRRGAAALARSRGCKGEEAPTAAMTRGQPSDGADARSIHPLDGSRWRGATSYPGGGRHPQPNRAVRGTPTGAVRNVTLRGPASAEWRGWSGSGDGRSPEGGIKSMTKCLRHSDIHWVLQDDSFSGSSCGLCWCSRPGDGHYFFISEL
jgi:hypothetical protein